LDGAGIRRILRGIGASGPLHIDVIPADGFYEWKPGDGKAKQPHQIRMANEGPFAVAGLCERWKAASGETVDSCTSITADANTRVSDVHDRMPVILPEEAFNCWLDPRIEDPAQLEPLLKPYPPEEMATFLVSTFVNSPKNDSLRCVATA
jgi:putative SOS response-associated peptidase YedK